MTLIHYDQNAVTETPLETPASLGTIRSLIDQNQTVWLQVEGLGQTDYLEAIGTLFDIHPLVLEDILNTRQRTKFEDYPDYHFMVLKAFTFTVSTQEQEEQDQNVIDILHEQISIIEFNNLVITFKEQSDSLFEPVRKRLMNNQKRLRSGGADYLTYALLDCIVDSTFDLLDTIDDIIETLELELMDDPKTETLNRIQDLKRELIYLRRAVSPLRELISALLTHESGLIKESTRIYLRDVQDHVIRISDTLELQRDLVYGLLGMYQSSISNKMNEVMKTLTVFASIFIPLTFIAGVYGMNFEHMPELKHAWAYPAIWLVFISISAGLLVYFKRKNWW